MGRKSSAKSQNQPVNKDAGGNATASGKGPSPLIIGAIIVALVGVGVLRSGGRPVIRPQPPRRAAQKIRARRSGADPVAEARAASLAKLGPHKQASLPPVPFQVGYQPPRSADVVTAAYQFAAEHPEILSYVPCFCGCERAGHQGNHDCFVRSRDENGDVIAWDEHGVDCAVCLDVATRSRQMVRSRRVGERHPGGDRSGIRLAYSRRRHDAHAAPVALAAG